MSFWIGDAYSGCTLTGTFTTVSSTGAPSALSGNPLGLVVWKLVGAWSCSTAGLTLSLDCKGATGWNGYSINTNADAAFYSCGADYALQLTGGTVNSVCVQYYTIANFSLKNRASLRPTIVGRELDVSTGGEGGVDWANVGSQSTTVNLTGTTVSAGFTEQGLACTVWNSLQSNYDTCGTFGVLLDCKTSAALQPTSPGNRLDVTSTGAAGVDWGNVENKTTPNVLSGTSIDGVTTVTTVVNPVSGVSGNVTGSVANVLAVSDKTGYSLSCSGVDAIWDCLLTEPVAVFAWADATPRKILAFVGAKETNQIAQSNSQQGICNRAVNARIAVASVSCSSDVVTRGSFV